MTGDKAFPAFVHLQVSKNAGFCALLGVMTGPNRPDLRPDRNCQHRIQPNEMLEQ